MENRRPATAGKVCERPLISDGLVDGTEHGEMERHALASGDQRNGRERPTADESPGLTAGR